MSCDRSNSKSLAILCEIMHGLPALRFQILCIYINMSKFQSRFISKYFIIIILVKDEHALIVLFSRPLFLYATFQCRRYNLFTKKCFFPPKKYFPQKIKNKFTFFLCNFSVRTLQCFQNCFFFFFGKNFFFSEKPVFFRAKNKTVIRRGPNPNVCLLVWGFMIVKLSNNSY